MLYDEFIDCFEQVFVLNLLPEKPVQKHVIFFLNKLFKYYNYMSFTPKFQL
jgi:hypothetical protein